mgnify:CR=1 FL=1
MLGFRCECAVPAKQAWWTRCVAFRLRPSGLLSVYEGALVDARMTQICGGQPRARVGCSLCLLPSVGSRSLLNSLPLRCGPARTEERAHRRRRPASPRVSEQPKALRTTFIDEFSSSAGLQPLKKPGSATLTTSLTAPNTLPGPSGASRKPLSKKGSRNLSPGGRKLPAEDDDSSGLSSLESDEDDAPPPAKAAPAALNKSGKPKRTVVAPPPKVVAAAPKARSKPALKAVSPPSVTRFPLPPLLPSSSVIAKLYIREFFVRFHGLMPCLSLSARQSTRTARVVLTALEEPERFWGPGADVNQRVLLEACLDLLLDDFKHLYEGPLEAERRAWVEEAIEDVAQAKKSASVDVAAVPWATVWAGIKEGKAGGWSKLEQEWTSKRDQAEESGEKARRAVKGEIGLEKRLACMCALVDLCAETQSVRKDMNNVGHSCRAVVDDVGWLTRHRSFAGHRHGAHDEDRPQQQKVQAQKGAHRREAKGHRVQARGADRVAEQGGRGQGQVEGGGRQSHKRGALLAPHCG